MKTNSPLWVLLGLMLAFILFILTLFSGAVLMRVVFGSAMSVQANVTSQRRAYEEPNAAHDSDTERYQYLV